MANWKEQTCQKCKYRVENECRRFPPGIFTVITGVDSGVEEAAYPQVKYLDGFSDACAEYTEEGQVKEFDLHEHGEASFHS